LQDISEIKIVAIDEKRPPKVRKEPYIDLFFKLSRQVPEDWCDEFHKLTGKMEPTIKINKKEGLFVETYVRDMHLIQEHLDKIRQKIADCNKLYIANIRQRELAEAAKIAALLGDGGKQGVLNQIIATLKFDD